MIFIDVVLASFFAHHIMVGTTMVKHNAIHTKLLPTRGSPAVSNDLTLMLLANLFIFLRCGFSRTLVLFLSEEIMGGSLRNLQTYRLIVVCLIIRNSITLNGYIEVVKANLVALNRYLTDLCFLRSGFFKTVV
jgi:hypothetical protein